jgi:hypothetical protein
MRLRLRFQAGVGFWPPKPWRRRHLSAVARRAEEDQLLDEASTKMLRLRSAEIAEYSRARRTIYHIKTCGIIPSILN